MKCRLMLNSYMYIMLMANRCVAHGDKALIGIWLTNCKREEEKKKNVAVNFFFHQKRESYPKKTVH